MPVTQKTTTAPATQQMKLCLRHCVGGKEVPISRFADNVLTHDGKDLHCRSCSTRADLQGRMAWAAEQMRRAGVRPCTPITMTLGELQ